MHFQEQCYKNVEIWLGEKKRNSLFFLRETNIKQKNVINQRTQIN